MAHELEVWLFANPVGSLSLVGGRLGFAYHANWLARPDAMALSCSLPLQAQAFDDIHSRPFFAGLGPVNVMCGVTKAAARSAIKARDATCAGRTRKERNAECVGRSGLCGFVHNVNRP